ncbi:MAG: hypothetical protein K2M65_02175, partial [Muribaculaceae bacterium]|nr:hypothetical protein [Muribaculaceae bacterium]
MGMNIAKVHILWKIEQQSSKKLHVECLQRIKMYLNVAVWQIFSFCCLISVRWWGVMLKIDILFGDGCGIRY